MKSTDEKYFENLYNELNSGKVDRAFYEYLMKQDIKNYDFQKSRPVTKLYNDMKEACIPLLIKYFIDIIDNNQSLSSLDFKANEFFNNYNGFIKEVNYKYETNLTQFGKDLNDYQSINKIKKRDGIHYIINITELKEKLIKDKLYNSNILFIDEEEDEIISPLDRIN